MEAALGIGQMERKDQILGARQKNASYLLKKLKPLEKYLQLPWCSPKTEHSFMMFPIVVREGVGVKKQDLVMHLEEHNMETRDMLPLLNQPVYKELFGDLEKKYPR
jgi:dTDP-4-amino-4,6-dideoxygalactose transaminase